MSWAIFSPGVAQSNVMPGRPLKLVDNNGKYDHESPGTLAGGQGLHATGSVALPSDSVTVAAFLGQRVEGVMRLPGAWLIGVEHAGSHATRCAVQAGRKFQV